MMYLLDSNIIIYAAMDTGSPANAFIKDQSLLAISFVTYLEVLGYRNLTPANKKHFRAFFDQLEMKMMNDQLLALSVELRQNKAMSLGDAIIAATAIAYDQTLVTHNKKDFQHIEQLKMLDPFDA